MTESRDVSQSWTSGQQWLFWSGVVLLCLTRLVWLEARPLHFDEGVNGWWLDQIQVRGFYPYDSGLFHGPLFFYGSYWIQQFLGTSLWALRLPSALAGIGAGLMMLGFSRWLGHSVALVGLLLFALSPGLMVFSRDAIHEPWFLAATVAMIYGGFRFWGQDRISPPRLGWLAVGAVAMMALKETWWMLWLAMLGAWWLVVITEESGEETILDPVMHRLMGSVTRVLDRLKNASGLGLGWLAWGVGVLFLLYSGFGAYGEGINQFLDSFMAWFRVGIADPVHIKPWWYFGWLWVCNEWLLALGLLGGLALWHPAQACLMTTKQRLGLRWVWCYGLLVLLGFSIIPYKTPWNVMPMLWPFSLVGGWVVTRLWSGVAWRGPLFRVGVMVVMLLSLLKAGWLSTWGSTNPLEPYVYGQSTVEQTQLVADLTGRLTVNLTEPDTPTLVVVSPSAWPLPWLLRAWPSVSYMKPSQWALYLKAHPNTHVPWILIQHPVGVSVGQGERSLRAVKTYQLRPGVPMTLYQGGSR